MKRAATKAKAVAAPGLGNLAVVSLAVVAPLAPGLSRVQVEALDIAALLVGCTALVALCLLVLSGRVAAFADRLKWSWASLIMWFTLSALASGRVWAALVGEPTNMLGLATVVSLLVIAVWASTDRMRVAELLVAIAPYVVLIECAVAGLDMVRGLESGGTVGNSTYLGEALVLLLPWVVATGSRGGRLAFRVGLAVVAIGILAGSGSRVATVVALAWAIWRIARAPEVSVRVRVAVSAASVLAAVAAAIAFAQTGAWATSMSSVLGLRPRMWDAALRAVLDRPLLGWGPDGFMAGGAAASTLEWARSTGGLVFGFGATDPHSLLVWVLVSGGLVGLALAVWAVAESGVAAWRAQRSGARYAGTAMSGLVMLLMVAFSAPLTPAVIPLLALNLGVASGAGVTHQMSSRAKAAALLPLAMVFVLVFTAAARLPLERYSAERSPSVVGTAVAMAGLSPLDAHLAYLGTMHLGYSGPARDVALELELSRRSVRVDSRNPVYALEHVRVLGSLGAPIEEIEAAFADLLTRWPSYPLGRAEYALFLAQTGRAQEAREQLALSGVVSGAGPAYSELVGRVEAALQGPAQ